MKVHLCYFASVRERLGQREGELVLPDEATVRDLWSRLREVHPQLAELGGSISFAVNQEYVEAAHVLNDGDEVALIPPVSGGG
jgi:molybdopterin converting factor subunit 1